jgi:hypothetical protein
LSVIKSRNLFTRIGESARKTAEEKADWQKNFGKLLEAYEKVIALRLRADEQGTPLSAR